MKNINNNLFTQIKYVSNDERKGIKKYIEEYNKNLEKKRKIKENIFSCFKYIFFSPLAIAMGLLSALFKLCGTIVALAMPYGFYCLYKLIVTLKQNKEWTEAREVKYVVAFVIFPFIAFGMSLMFEKIANYFYENK